MTTFYFAKYVSYNYLGMRENKGVRLLRVRYFTVSCSGTISIVEQELVHRSLLSRYLSRQRGSIRISGKNHVKWLESTCHVVHTSVRFHDAHERVTVNYDSTNVTNIDRCFRAITLLERFVVIIIGSFEFRILPTQWYTLYLRYIIYIV